MVECERTVELNRVRENVCTGVGDGNRRAGGNGQGGRAIRSAYRVGVVASEDQRAAAAERDAALEGVLSGVAEGECPVLNGDETVKAVARTVGDGQRIRSGFGERSAGCKATGAA